MRRVISIRVPPRIAIPILSFTFSYLFLPLFSFLLLSQLYRLLRISNIFSQIKQIHPENCTHVPGPVFCEHVTVLKNGLAVVSCDRHRMQWNPVMGKLDYGVKGKGEFWAISLADRTRKAIPIPLPSDFNDDFHPLGFDIFCNNDDEPCTLTSINLRRKSPTIEIFSFNPSSLSLNHTKTLKSRQIRNPNSIHSTSPTTFYFTTDFDTPSKNLFARNSEKWLGLPGGRANYFNGTHVQIIASPFRFANGVSVHDNLLAVAETLGGNLHIYNLVNPTRPCFMKTIYLGYCVDNVHITDTHIYVAGHPRPLSMVLKLKGRDVGRLPSKVVRIKKETWEVETVLEDDGELIESSAGAVEWEVDGRKGIIVAGLYEERGVLVCEE